MAKTKTIRRHCSICRRTTAHDPILRVCLQEHDANPEKPNASQVKAIKATKKSAQSTKQVKQKPVEKEAKVVSVKEAPVVSVPAAPKSPKSSKKPPAKKSVKRVNSEHKFHYITWNGSAYGYQLKLNFNGVEKQPFYISLLQSVQKRNAYFKQNKKHRPNGMLVRKVTYNEAVRSKVRIGPSSHIAIEYQFNRYTLAERKYHPVSRRDENAIREIFNEHSKAYNEIAALYNKAREKRFLEELEREAVEMVPCLDLRFDGDLWAKCAKDLGYIL
nr:conserved hypothetical protein [Vibrio chagasii]